MDIGNWSPNALRDKCVGETFTKHLMNLQHFCANVFSFHLTLHHWMLIRKRKKGNVTTNSNSN